MGHSHSHHDHHETEHPETVSLTPQQKRLRLRRRIALVTAVWMATCGPALLIKQKLSKSDWLSFAILSVALSSADKARRAIRSNIGKLARLKEGIVKHSIVVEDGEQNSSSSEKLRRDAKEADQVTWLGAIINLVLSVGKLFVGITQHSSALVADAGHSLSDLVSDFITLWTVKIARLPADEDHPYGHWKFEAIGSLFLSLTLIATALSVGAMSNKQLMEIMHNSGSGASAAAKASSIIVPGKLALVMAAISIASKEWLYRITKKVGEKIRSQVVIANAWHHRSDAYSSILALASIAWARTGVLAADAAAGLLVAGMIGMTGGEILMESVQQLSDGATPWLQKECEEHCQELFQKDSDDVDEISFVKARQVGSLSLVEVELLCPTSLSTTASRAVEERWKYWLHELYGYEATVHAKPNDKICPLLKHQKKETKDLAALQQLQQDHHHDHDHDKDDDDDDPTSSGASHNFVGVVNNGYKNTNGMMMEDINNDRASEAVHIVTTSAGAIESLAREQVRLFGGGSQVERVTVHYNPAFETSVDIILSSPPVTSSIVGSSTTPAAAAAAESLPHLVENGATLKESLQSLIEIDKANIYWDLSAMSLPAKKMAP
ncbi:MAG: hypothetical protein SGBAC_010094 [Bacillariaceae sp.]